MFVEVITAIGESVSTVGVLRFIGINTNGGENGKYSGCYETYL